MEIMTSWKREGLEEGLHKGVHKGVLSATARLLSMRVGTLPLSIQERLNGLSVEQLESLAEATFDIASMEDVEAWLAQRRL